MDSSVIVKEFRTRFGSVIANGQGSMKGQIFRIAHLGYFDFSDLFAIIAQLELILIANNVPVKLGAASAYPTALRDSTGQLFSGQQSYRLRVPADVPARDFWSVIVYSMQTKSMIPNAQNRVGFSSYDKATMQLNADGSLEIHFGPHPPSGRAANWIPTAGEDFFVIFRIYGPEKAFVDNTWKLPDIERA